MSVGPKVTAEIQRNSRTSDGMGGFTDSWQGLKKLKGQLFALRNRDWYKNSIVGSDSTHYFIVDYKDWVDITAEDRLVYKGQIYQITYVNNLAERNITIILELKKIT